MPVFSLWEETEENTCMLNAISRQSGWSRVFNLNLPCFELTNLTNELGKYFLKRVVCGEFSVWTTWCFKVPIGSSFHKCLFIYLFASRTGTDIGTRVSWYLALCTWNAALTPQHPHPPLHTYTHTLCRFISAFPDLQRNPLVFFILTVEPINL